MLPTITSREDAKRIGAQTLLQPTDMVSADGSIWRAATKSDASNLELYRYSPATGLVSFPKSAPLQVVILTSPAPETPTDPG